MSPVYLLKLCIIGAFNENINSNLFGFQIWGQSPQNVYGIGIVTHRLRVNSTDVNLIILTFHKNWTTSINRERHYSQSSALIIIFNKNNRASFNAIKDLHKGLPRNSVPIAIVGYSSTSEEVTIEEGRNLADALEVDYYETSSTDNGELKEIILDLTLKALKRRGVTGSSITTPPPPSKEDIKKARRAYKELTRKLIFEDQLATRIDINLPADAPPEVVDMHKGLLQEYQDPRVTIRHQRDIDEEEE
jgi:hypothetical protein